MKYPFRNVLFSIPALFTGLGFQYAAADLIQTGIPGITSTGESTSAIYDLTVQSANKTSSPFSTNDILSIVGTITPDSGDIGSTADLYLVAFYNDVVFQRDNTGQWSIWDLDFGSLKPASESLTLNNEQSLSIIENMQLPGSFQLYMGYRKEGDTKINFNGTPVPFIVNDLVFSEISVPKTLDEKRVVRATENVTIKGVAHDIAYKTLARTNQVFPKLGGVAGEDEIFGLLKDKDGEPLLQEDGSSWVCTNGSGPDHTSFLTYDDNLFAVTQLECSVGGAYVTKLNQDAEGNLSAVSTRSVDFSGENGTYVNCAGVTTPWNTHLGSEEYEPPMGIFNDQAENNAWFESPTWHDAHMQGIADYNKIGNTAENAAYFGYYYGWIPEINITSPEGDTEVDKHYSMGRFAHELAYVMPDKKTVYLSDDGTNVGLFMYIADTPEDLSAGNLYAAKWVQTSGQGAGSANIEWVSLGHATNSEIRAALDAHTTFGDMWDKAAPLDAAAGTCPADFRSTNTYDEGYMCVKLKSGKDKLASRLETRLYAAYLGATTEFRKEEGLTFNPEEGVLYVAMSELRKGMEDGSTNDIGGPNHIRLETTNNCGAVYGMKVGGSATDTNNNLIDSEYVAQNMYGIVSGTEKEYAGTDLEGNSCDVNGLANPDNLAYLPKYGALLIGEDTGRHQNDYVWNYEVKTKRLIRIATTPYGAETTSPFWHTNINGHGYITLVTQHPYGESDADKAESSADKESYVGYIGPFPALD